MRSGVRPRRGRSFALTGPLWVDPEVEPVPMSSCLVTRSAVIVFLDNGKRLEIARVRTDPPEKLLDHLRLLFVLDRVKIDQSIP
jgi:hypothetical protein